jgi:hypothetical protein
VNGQEEKQDDAQITEEKASSSVIREEPGRPAEAVRKRCPEDIELASKPDGEAVVGPDDPGHLGDRRFQ